MQTNLTFSVPSLLADQKVELQLMTLDHAQGLYQAGQHPDIWQWTMSNYCPSLQGTEQWIQQCLSRLANHQQIPFVIVEKSTQRIVGSTSYLHLAPEHKALEIGYTFLTPEAQGTGINRHCKYLLLQYAFEQLKVNRVCLQTNQNNKRSRAAISAIGATFEGILRNDRIMANGDIRSSAFYSILNNEWQLIKQQLLAQVGVRQID